MRLGELADRVEPKYGDKTLAKFAAAIGLQVATLNRCRSVYRAWKKIEIKGSSPKFALLQALQGHPKRDEIINNIKTVREARTIMKDYRVAQGQEEDWRVEETRRWFGQAEKHAREGIQYGHPAKENLDSAILRQALDEPDKLVATLRADAQGKNRLADIVESAFAPPALLPPPMFDDKATSDEAASGDGSSDNTASGDGSSDEDTPDNTTPDQTA
jgi:hypothetical protein